VQRTGRVHTLGNDARLKLRAEIARCRDQGEKLYSKHFLILVLPSPTSKSRLAIAVTTKIDKRAVVRNLVKRRLREVFRMNRHRFVKPLDLLIVARRNVQECTFEDYQREVLGALRSARLLPKS
jgi:ribonuclease P protein component